MTDENGTLSHGPGHMGVHEPAPAGHAMGHHSHAKNTAKVQTQTPNRVVAHESGQTHTCLQENCAKDTTAINEVVAPSHNALFIAWHEGEQTEGEYIAHTIDLAFFETARAPPALAPPNNPSNTLFDSPLSRFDRLII